VFEFTSAELGAQSGVAGGGRYDGLVQRLGGPPTPGMGWAAGVERILLAGEAAPDARGAPQLFLALADGERASRRRSAFLLLAEALTAGLRAEMELSDRSLKGQLGHAAALGARFVAIVDSDEAVLRDMHQGSQRRLQSDAVVETVLRALREA
jgi:histidyl-tRNA synthetase